MATVKFVSIKSILHLKFFEEVFGCDSFFLTSAALNDYVNANNVITWHGDYGMGSLLFIDSDSLHLHVVFDTRSDYEDWLASGSPIQISLF